MEYSLESVFPSAETFEITQEDGSSITKEDDTGVIVQEEAP